MRGKILLDNVLPAFVVLYHISLVSSFSVAKNGTERGLLFYNNK